MGTLRVKEAFAISDTDGVQRVFAPGDLVDEKDGAVKGREHLFETVEVSVGRRARRATVEQATAAPDEKRSLPRSKWRKAAAANQEESEGESESEDPEPKAETEKPAAKKTASGKKAADS